MGMMKNSILDDTALGEFRKEYCRKGYTVGEFPYLNEDGSPAFTAVRADKEGCNKICRPFRSDGSFGYPKGKLPLYNLRKLGPGRNEKYTSTVIVVEGEKCVAVAEKVFPECDVVTWAGGTQSIDKKNWKALETRTVLIIADNDDPGRNAARKIADKLKKAYCTVTVYAREGNDAKDITDWYEEKGPGGIEALREEIETCARSGNDAPATVAIGKVLDFPVIEPWPDAVDGDALLSELAVLITRYISLKPSQAHTVVLWVAMTHIHDHQNIETAPFLNLSSPVKRSGKTATMTIIKSFVPRALPLSDYSSSSLFRVIEYHHPTLLLDEIDLKGANKSEDNGNLSALLNGSQSRDTAYIMRSTAVQAGNKTDWVAVTFDTWCPKVLCGIRGLRDTTLDRSIQIRLERKHHAHKLPRWRNRNRDDVLRLHRRIVRWTADHREEIVAARDAVGKHLPAFLNDRECDAWELLLAVASIAGKSWLDRGLDACREIARATGDTQS